MSLAQAVLDGNLKKVKHLLFVEKVSPNGHSPSAMLCIANRTIEINEDDEEEDDVEVNPPLMIAVDLKKHDPTDYDEIVDILLDHPDIDITETNHEGGNILHLAVINEHLSIIRKVLNNPAYPLDNIINKTDIDDNTPLDWAIGDAGDDYNIDIVKMLIEAGATVKWSHLYTVVNLIYQDEQEAIDLFEYLLTKVNIDNILIADYINLISIVVENHSYIALDAVCRHFPDKVIEAIKLDDNLLFTAIEHEVTEYNEERSIVKCLLKYGANVNVILDELFNLTPLHVAVVHKFNKYQGENRVKLIELLLSYGADRTLKDNKGMTPSDIARDKYRFIVSLDRRHNYKDDKYYLKIANLIDGYNNNDIKEPDEDDD